MILQQQAGADVETAIKIGKEAVLRTTMGDIRYLCVLLRMSAHMIAYGTALPI